MSYLLRVSCAVPNPRGDPGVALDDRRFLPSGSKQTLFFFFFFAIHGCIFSLLFFLMWHFPPGATAPVSSGSALLMPSHSAPCLISTRLKLWEMSRTCVDIDEEWKRPLSTSADYN